MTASESPSGSPSQSPGEAPPFPDPFEDLARDLYPAYALARESAPVFFSPAVNAWVVTRYDDVRAALRDPGTFSSANALRPLGRPHPATIAEFRKGYPPSPGTIDTDGEVHKRQRAPLARALSPTRIDAAEPFIRRRAGELLDGLAERRDAGGTVDLMAAYGYPLPVAVIAHLLDLEPDDAATVSRRSYNANLLTAGHLPEEAQAAAARDYISIMKLCGRYVRARRARPGDDLVSDVVSALGPSGDEPLSLAEEGHLARTVAGVVIAGHITTSGLIGAAVRDLLADGEQWRLLCERPELIGDAVEEVARLDTPVHGFLRVTTGPVTVAGVDLPAGAEVLLVYASANRDEALCERPDDLDVTRGPTRHLAFGGGPHHCVGAGLARRELAVSLELLTRRFPTLTLVPDQPWSYEASLSAHGLRSLLVTW